MKHVLLIFAVISTFTSYVVGQTGFHTDAQGRLLDDNGNEFIMKGINTPLTWFQNEVYSSIDDMKTNLGVNALRIVIADGSRWTETPEHVWKAAVEKCIENEIIPILEVHDYTGYTNTGDPSKAAQWFVKYASYFNQPEIKKHILINIANEWGDFFKAREDANNANGGSWLTAYKSAISVLRAADINTTLIIDATGYGQDIYNAQNIRDDAPALMSHDAGIIGQANLMFSLHMYCQWAVTGEHQDDPAIVGTIKNSGIPIMVGEFGYQHSESGGTCDIDELNIINQCEAAGVGWLAWSQKGNSGNISYLDLCNDWECTNLSPWGNTVVNSANGTKSGETCTVFLDGNKRPITEFIAPNNNSSFEASQPIVLSAEATDEDGTVVSVEFFNGNSSLGTDNSEPYSITVNSLPVGEYTITAVATDNLGAKTTNPDAITITVTPIQCPSADLGEDIFLCDASSVVLNSGTSVYQASYSWQRNNSAIAGSSNTLSISTPGTYSVNVTKSGCNSSSDEIVVMSGELEGFDDAICEAGEASLSVAGGSGNGYNWYASASSNEVIATGSTFTPNITSNTTYYVEEESIIGGITTEIIGQQAQSNGATFWDINDFATEDKQVKITVTSEITLTAVSVFPANSNTNVTLRVRTEGGQLEGSNTVNNLGPGKQRIPLDIRLSPGVYILDAVGTSDKLFYDATSGNFPYSLNGMVSIDGNAPWVQEQGRYGCFYDWEFSYGELIEVEVCARIPVEATINANLPGCVTSTEDNLEGSISAYPNPVVNTLQIEGEFAGDWYLINLLGEVVLQGNDNWLDVSNLSSGVYHLKVEDQLIRVIKQ